MNMSHGVKSLALFVIAVLFLFLLTLFESSLLNLSIMAERILSLLLLVVPALIGILFGVMGVRAKEDRLWTSVLGILLNALFALFHFLLLSFAG